MSFWKWIKEEQRKYRHGKHRPTGTQNHSHPDTSASTGTGGAKETDPVAAAYQAFLAGQSSGLTIAPPSTVRFGHSIISAGATFAPFIKASLLIEMPKPRPLDIPYGGVQAGEITAYRAWLVGKIPYRHRFSEREYELCSIAHRHIWEPGEIVSGDVDQVVDYDYQRDMTLWGGVYSFKTRMNMFGDLAPYSRFFTQRPGVFSSLQSFPHLPHCVGMVFGEISIWGEVVKYTAGYRAQFAKITSFDDRHFGKVDIDKLRETYLK